jgi:endo-1,4-beta-xylanase
MSTDPQDVDWIGPLLSAHAERHDLDVHALVERVMAQVPPPADGDPYRVSPEVPPARGGRWRRWEVHLDAGRAREWRRLTPVALAAAVVVLVALAASTLPRRAHWPADARHGGTVQVEGDRPATGGPSSPAPTVRRGPNPSSTSAGTTPSASAGATPSTSAGTTVGTTVGASAGATAGATAGASAGTTAGASTATIPGASTGTVPDASAGTTPSGSRGLPSVLRWRSSGPLIAPKPDPGHPVTGVKDPTVVYDGGRWHLFSTVVSPSGYGLEYRSFTDWATAGSATPYYLDRSGIGAGYRAAPQVFYFAPQKLWYLVFQTGNASYSTNPDIADPAGWSAPKNFYPGMPAIISQNIGSGFWVDMWVICDSSTCYLFSSDDNGHLYRSQTSLAAFPQGMSQPVVALQETDANRLREAAKVFTIAGTDRYLLLAEAFGPTGRRYSRSWTGPSPAGPWTALADSPSQPFAEAGTVTSTGTPWTLDISHGEPLRAGTDQTLTIDPCRLQYVYDGHDPAAGGSQEALPWRLGLLTQTNSTC